MVVKDVPGNGIAAGNPCKVLREITEEDRRYWEEKRRQYEALRSADAGRPATLSAAANEQGGTYASEQSERLPFNR